MIESMSANAERGIFTDVAQDEEKLPNCAGAFGTTDQKLQTFLVKERWQNLSGPWRQAKAQYEVKTTADAAAKVHGER